jgi:hypothetical protein
MLQERVETQGEKKLNFTCLTVRLELFMSVCPSQNYRQVHIQGQGLRITEISVTTTLQTNI